MKKLYSFKLTLASLCMGLTVSSAYAEPNSKTTKEGFFLRPYVGLSQMSDLDAQSAGIGAIDGKAEIDVETGFVSGLGFGYRYNPEIAVEIAWEYRSNDSETMIADGTQFKEGNYASNIFYLNGFYFFDVQDRWESYVGTGIGWIQEIDLDLENSGVEQSYSGEGDISYQAFLGANYHLSSQFSINGELRYSMAKNIDLEGEGVQGKLSDLDYSPATLQLGLTYSF